MPRFSVSDTVLVLSKFARGHPSNVGIVAKVKVDMLRPLFDEYLVEFSDGSTGTLFDFQLLEDTSHYQTILATLKLDSSGETGSIPMRGAATARQIVFQSDDVDIHLRITPSPTGTRILGQILGKNGSQFPPQMEVRLLLEGKPIDVAMTNDLGEFRFGKAPEGTLTVEILIRANLSRILGTFSMD